jgi:hypothetical protein
MKVKRSADWLRQAPAAPNFTRGTSAIARPATRPRQTSPGASRGMTGRRGPSCGSPTPGGATAPGQQRV